jgi:hypothetical protein
MCKENRKNCVWTKEEDALIQKNVLTYSTKQEAFGATAKELTGRTRGAVSLRYYSVIAKNKIDSPKKALPTKIHPVSTSVEPLRFGSKGQISFDIKSVRVIDNKVIFEF